jgi:sec-independent protein translocase protein TatA
MVKGTRSVNMMFIMPGTQELIIIAVIILVLFGGTALPRFMRGIGQSVSEFRKATQDPATFSGNSSPQKTADS